MKVRNNVASLNSLRHANENFNRVSDSVEKLSSGMKINRAKDAPANLIASERFRGNIAGLKQLKMFAEGESLGDRNDSSN